MASIQEPKRSMKKKIFLISTKTGKILGSVNLLDAAMKPHSLSLSDDASEVYIANLNPSEVFKYVLINYKRNLL